MDDATLTSVPHPADPASLPGNPAVLQQMIRELLATLHARDRELEGVRHRLDQLLRRLYGPRAEKIDPAQLLLFAEAPQEPAAPAPPLTTDKPMPRHPGHGRRRLPRDLPRQQILHELPEAERACPGCGHARAPIGRERSERLDYRPASLFVVEHVRVTYACPRCQAQAERALVETAPKPPAPLERALPGPGLLAHVSVAKYADHLPLHRQARILERHGLLLPRSTICDWMAAMAVSLTPLCQRMRELVLLSRLIQTDDTPVPVLDGRRDRTRQGRVWVYLGDRLHPYTVFDYTPTHSRDGPETFLRGFHGCLQADAYAGYDALFRADPALFEVGCWAHARRGFYEARTSDPERAHAALAWVRRLYDVEDAAKATLPEGASPDRAEAALLERRQAEAVPLLSSFCQWLQEQRRQVLPKSPLGQAVSYALGNWAALTRYTEQGFLPPDNNASERALRGIGIGRKNYLFFGSDTGGRTAAVHYSIIAGARRHGRDPFAYLRDVLTRLPALPADRLDELLPDRWQPAAAAPTP